MAKEFRKLPSYAVIIRAEGGNGSLDQRRALAELYRRGLWLHDGSNGGDDQQARAILAGGFGAEHLASKPARDAALRSLGYGPEKL